MKWAILIFTNSTVTGWGRFTPMDGHIEQQLGLKSLFRISRDTFFHWGLCFCFLHMWRRCLWCFGGVFVTSHQFISVADPNCRNPHDTYRSDRSPGDSGFCCSTKMHDMICTPRIIGPSSKGFDYVWLCNMVLGSPSRQFWDPIILRVCQFSFDSPEFLAWFLSTSSNISFWVRVFCRSTGNLPRWISAIKATLIFCCT